jgi:chromosome partitioning protein
MSVPVLTFFNNKGGVGKTSLVFHLAWMMSILGKRVVAIDLDPQANLSTAFLDEDVLEQLWDPDDVSQRNTTIYQCIRPLTQVGDILEPKTIQINDRLQLIPGDLSLAGFEDFLSREWPNAMGSESLYRPFRILTAFWQVAQMAAKTHQADIILADVGPNLGAVNRSALIGSDHVVIPLAADLFSLQGLQNLGPVLTAWRKDWIKRVENWRQPEFALPKGSMQPEGYILMQHAQRLRRPAKAYKRWADRIPASYQRNVLGQSSPSSPPTSPESDSRCLAQLKHYRSLMPMAQEVRKPIFQLTPADGAIGNHALAVKDANADFFVLAFAILSKLKLADNVL